MNEFMEKKLVWDSEAHYYEVINLKNILMNFNEFCTIFNEF